MTNVRSRALEGPTPTLIEERLGLSNLKTCVLSSLEMIASVIMPPAWPVMTTGEKPVELTVSFTAFDGI